MTACVSARARLRATSSPAVASPKSAQMQTKRSVRLEGVNNYSPALKAFLASASASAAAAVASAYDDDDDDVVCSGSRTLDERNAEGFANAIVLDD